jgi:hypothetical protein
LETDKTWVEAEAIEINDNQLTLRAVTSEATFVVSRTCILAIIIPPQKVAIGCAVSPVAGETHDLGVLYVTGIFIRCTLPRQVHKGKRMFFIKIRRAQIRRPFTWEGLVGRMADPVSTTLCESMEIRVAIATELADSNRRVRAVDIVVGGISTTLFPVSGSNARYSILIARDLEETIALLAPVMEPADTSIVPIHGSIPVAPAGPGTGEVIRIRRTLIGVHAGVLFKPRD